MSPPGNSEEVPSREIPKEFEKLLMDAQNPPRGKGAIIIPGTKSETKHVVYYLLDKHEVLGNRDARRRPRIIKIARVIETREDGYVFYGATFGSIDPGDYLVWRSETGRKPTAATAGDLSLSRGAGVVPDKASRVYFD